MCGVRSCGCVALVVGCGVARLLDCCVALLSGCGVALLPARPVDLRARGEGVVQYPGKVACPSGRRCSTRNAVWCHSHPGFKSQRYRHCRPAPMGPGGFVMPEWRVGACTCCGMLMVFWAPLVFRVPSGPAAREIATREPTARSGRSRSPPWPSGPSGTLHTGGACIAVTSPARPYRMGTAAWVSGLSTQWRPVVGADWCVGSKRARALRTLWHPPHRRRLCRCVWLGASPRSPARPCRRPRAPQPGPPCPPAPSTPASLVSL